MLAAQKAAAKDEPSAEDIYEIGCVANILQMLKLPDGTVKVLVEGAQRATHSSHQRTGNAFLVRLDAARIRPRRRVPKSKRCAARSCQQFDQYVKLNKKIPPEILTSLAGIDDAGRLADTIAAHLPLKLEQKQDHSRNFPGHQASRASARATRRRTRHPAGRKAHPWARQAPDGKDRQREYYLNEQVKAIQKELGEGEEGADLEELEKHIIAAQMPKEAKKKADAELKKLKLMSPMSAEATVVRNYIDTLIGLPWRKKSKVNNDLSNAERVLEEDHFGLEKVKERILEYLAVQQRVDKVKAPILCLVGPPGVGKTSLGQSIARATNRKFVRMALGGVRDEAEIRGHRRTYIGSMPGKILQSLAKVGVRNPLVPARRSRQDGHGFPRRSGVGAAGSARSGTEPYVLRSLRRSRFRPVGCDVRRDVELAEHSAAAARPDGSDSPVGLYRGREGQHRAALSAAEADQRTTA